MDNLEIVSVALGATLIVTGAYFYYFSISTYIGFVQNTFGILIPEDARRYAELILAAQIIVGGLLCLLPSRIEMGKLRW